MKNFMKTNKKIKLDEDLISKILNENDAVEIGIFMSILAYGYIKCCGIDNKRFLKSLENSLKTIEKTKKEIGHGRKEFTSN